MYAFHAATLVLAASAVVPILSAPLATRSTSDVVARDAFPLGARDPELSVNNIRDLLDSLNLRSEDVIAALYKRDGGIADSILPRSRIVKPFGRDTENDPSTLHGPIHTTDKRSTGKVFGRDTVSARDYSEPLDSLKRDGNDDPDGASTLRGPINTDGKRSTGKVFGRDTVSARDYSEPLGSLKRDGPVDDIQARSFFDDLGSFFSGAVDNGFLDDPNIALRSIADRRASANKFIKVLSKISSRDGVQTTTSRRDDSGRKLSRGDDLLSKLVRSLERDNLIDDIHARGFFDDLGSFFSDAVDNGFLDDPNIALRSIADRRAFAE
ncbi:hypothetical protein H4582DRAFT_2057514 [Lactarius indigo]|nr:hypothetical protein H4582DRAFT_2057514 [Lactarius indigo]